MDKVMKSFKESMGHLATGVTIVTTEVDDRPWGITVSACCSISMDPPLLLVSLFTKNTSTESIKNQHRFGVSILTNNQVEIARAGSKPGTPKFFEEFIDYDSDIDDTYPVKNALAHIHCKVENTIVAGDHTIFIGLVEDVHIGETSPPLLYYQRQFGDFISKS